MKDSKASSKLEGVNLDEKIRDLVLLLNRLEIPTTGSCEGHVGYGSPAPWIKITPPESDNGQTKKKIEELLVLFYKHHTPEKDAHLIIENANFGFWIHNGGIDYTQWREKVKERAILHKKREEVHELIIHEEQKHREKTMPTYHKEILFFTEFLKNKLIKGA